MRAGGVGNLPRFNEFAIGLRPTVRNRLNKSSLPDRSGSSQVSCSLADRMSGIGG